MSSFFNSLHEKEHGRTSHIKKVLIVDDESIWQVFIARAIRKIFLGVDISFVENARMAIKEIEARDEFDFIVSDLNLGEPINGLDLWDMLCERDSQIPFVLMSGTSRVDFFSQIMSYREQAVPSFLQKPERLGALPDMLWREFRNASYPTRSK